MVKNKDRSNLPTAQVTGEKMTEDSQEMEAIEIDGELTDEQIDKVISSHGFIDEIIEEEEAAEAQEVRVEGYKKVLPQIFNKSGKMRKHSRVLSEKFGLLMHQSAALMKRLEKPECNLIICTEAGDLIVKGEITDWMVNNGIIIDLLTNGWAIKVIG
jgi:hypothetical protein